MLQAKESLCFYTQVCFFCMCTTLFLTCLSVVLALCLLSSEASTRRSWRDPFGGTCSGANQLDARRSRKVEMDSRFSDPSYHLEDYRIGDNAYASLQLV